MRACEQVRSFVAYPHLNVKLVGLNGGMYGGEREGVTHMVFEEFGILRLIAGMEIVVPADAGQVRQATRVLAQRPGPAYLRLGSGREPVIFEDSMEFEFGKARVLREYGNEAAVFAIGPILKRAILAVEALAREGIRTTLVEVHTLKPLDVETVSAVLRSTRAAVSAGGSQHLRGPGKRHCRGDRRTRACRSGEASFAGCFCRIRRCPSTRCSITSKWGFPM